MLYHRDEHLFKLMRHAVTSPRCYIRVRAGSGVDISVPNVIDALSSIAPASTQYFHALSSTKTAHSTHQNTKIAL